MKPAPALHRTSPIGSVKPVGAPFRSASWENEYWVFAMQMGRAPKPCSVNMAIFASAAPSKRPRPRGTAPSRWSRSCACARRALVQESEVIGARVGLARLRDSLAERRRTLAALRVVGAQHAVVRAGGHGGLLDHRVFRFGVGGEHVHRDDDGDAKLFGVLDVSGEVRDALLDEFDVFVGVLVRQGLARGHRGPAAVELEGP